MYNDTECLPKLREKIDSNKLEQKQLHDVTTLAAELKSLLVRHSAVLKQEGVRNEMQRLEDWLETERKGPAPAGIISESGVAWLSKLRDKLKLSVEEAQRLESEGGNPCSDEQSEKTEDLLKTIRRIDAIINENSAVTSH
jgi:hypothetical protein